MTEEERREAEWLADNARFDARLLSPLEQDIWADAWLAGRESMQATAELQREMFGPAGVKHIGDLIIERNAERARHAKLVWTLRDAVQQNETNGYAMICDALEEFEANE